MRLTIVILVAATTVSCSAAPQPKPIDAFSTANRAGNATKLAALISQQCLGRASKLYDFEAGLRATGWLFNRTQTANPANPLELDAWVLPGITVLRGQPVTGSVWTCSVSLAKPLAPNLGLARASLARLATNSSEKNDEWRWTRDRHRFHMDVGASEDGGVFVNVEDYRLPWWRSILG